MTHMSSSYQAEEGGTVFLPPSTLFFHFVRWHPQSVFFNLFIYSRKVPAAVQDTCGDTNNTLRMCCHSLFQNLEILF